MKKTIIDSKKIYLGNSFLDDSEIDRIFSEILESNSKNLILYFNSEGGSVSNGIALLDLISSLNCNTIGITIGSCMSMAVNVFLACKIRLCTPSSYFMIHQSSFEEGLKGQIETIKENIRVQDEMDSMLNSYIFKNSLITKDTLEDYFKHKTDMYFNSKEALEYGLVHKIMKNQKEIDKILIEGI